MSNNKIDSKTKENNTESITKEDELLSELSNILDEIHKFTETNITKPLNEFTEVNITKPFNDLSNKSINFFK